MESFSEMEGDSSPTDLQDVQLSHREVRSSLNELLNRLAMTLRDVFECKRASIFLRSASGKEVRLIASSPPKKAHVRRISLESDLEPARVVRNGAPLIVNDCDALSFSPSHPDVQSMGLVPIHSADRVMGVCVIESEQPEAFSKKEVRMVGALVNQAVPFIEATHLLKKSRATARALERWARNLMLINRFTTVLTASLDAADILNMTVQHLTEITSADYGCALLLERDRRHGRFVSEHPDRVLPRERISLPQTPLLQQPLTTGSPLQLETGDELPLLEPEIAREAPFQGQPVLLLPLIARGDPVGFLMLTRSEERTFSEEAVDICQIVAGQAAVAMANARLLQEIQQHRHALLLKSQQLADESNRLDAVLNQMADGLVVTDTDGRIVRSNPAFRAMAGLPQSHELKGEKISHIFTAIDLTSLIGEAIADSEAEIKKEFLLDDRNLSVTVAPLIVPTEEAAEIEGPQTTGAVVTLRDISAETETEHVRNEFIASVSHEFRAPLTSILGFTTLIDRDLNRHIIPNLEADEPALHAISRMLENLAIIEGESERLTRLINDMLDIAKIESGHLEWPVEQVDLKAAVEQAVSSASAQAEAKGLELHVQLQENLPPVEGNLDRLTQVITNLLNNAIKFTDTGSVTIRSWRLDARSEPATHTGSPPYGEGSVDAAMNALQKTDTRAQAWLVIAVTDTGLGINLDELPSLFAKFQQSTTVSEKYPQGSGLGLWICQEIVKQHGGAIWAESKEGEGSNFSFALPTQL